MTELASVNRDGMICDVRVSGYYRHPEARRDEDLRNHRSKKEVRVRIDGQYEVGDQKRD